MQRMENVGIPDLTLRLGRLGQAHAAQGGEVMEFWIGFLCGLVAGAMGMFVVAFVSLWRKEVKHAR